MPVLAQTPPVAGGVLDHARGERRAPAAFVRSSGASTARRSSPRTSGTSPFMTRMRSASGSTAASPTRAASPVPRCCSCTGGSHRRSVGPANARARYSSTASLPWPDDDDDLGAPRVERRLHAEVHDGQPGDGVHHLGEGALHSRSLPCGEDDGGRADRHVTHLSPVWLSCTRSSKHPHPVLGRIYRSLRRTFMRTRASLGRVLALFVPFALRRHRRPRAAIPSTRRARCRRAARSATELYGVVCDRLGGQSLHEDLTGASYTGICHPDATARSPSTVDRRSCRRCVDGQLDVDGNPVPLAQAAGRPRLRRRPPADARAAPRRPHRRARRDVPGHPDPHQGRR